MSASVNKAILVGRIAREIEVRKTQNGTSYCRFSVTCDRRKKQGEETATADFISCVAWRQSADFLGSYAQKGDLVSVEGSIQTGSYTDRDGRKVYTTDVLVDSVQRLESKKTSSGSSYSNNGTPLRKSDIDANDGFDVGDQADISDDDLPF